MSIASEIFHKSGNFIGNLVIYVDFLHTKYEKGCTIKMIHPFGNNKKLFMSFDYFFNSNELQSVHSTIVGFIS